MEEWVTRVAAELGISDVWAPADRDLVLDLARDAAHGIARPAAPLTTYLAGIAVGRGAEPTRVAAAVTALLAAAGDNGTAAG